MATSAVWSLGESMRDRARCENGQEIWPHWKTQRRIDPCVGISNKQIANQRSGNHPSGKPSDLRIQARSNGLIGRSERRTGTAQAKSNKKREPQIHTACAPRTPQQMSSGRRGRQPEHSRIQMGISLNLLFFFPSSPHPFNKYMDLRRTRKSLKRSSGGGKMRI